MMNVISIGSGQGIISRGFGVRRWGNDENGLLRCLTVRRWKSSGYSVKMSRQILKDSQWRSEKHTKGDSGAYNVWKCQGNLKEKSRSKMQ